MKGITKKIRLINQNSNHRTRPKQVFDDLIQLGFNLLTEHRFVIAANPFCGYFHRPGLRQELSSYKHEPEAWELLQEAFSEWIEAIKNKAPFTDVLGMLYDEQLGEVLGQFLTPPDVAKALAFIARPTVPEDEPVRLGDTGGCGAGSLILSQLSYIYEHQGSEAFRRVDVVGVDLDANMVKLTAFQVLMSALLHRIPLASLQIHHCHAITGYDDEGGGYSPKTLGFFYTHDRFHFQACLDRQKRTEEKMAA